EDVWSRADRALEERKVVSDVNRTQAEAAGARPPEGPAGPTAGGAAAAAAGPGAAEPGAAGGTAAEGPALSPRQQADLLERQHLQALRDLQSAQASERAWKDAV